MAPMPGEVLWEAAYGDAATDWVEQIDIGSDGSIVLAGWFEGSLDFGGGSLVSSGGRDAFVAKVDISGAEVFANQYGAAGDQEATGVGVDSNGNVLVFGEFDAPSIDLGMGPLNAVDELDMFLARLTPDGQVAFGERAGGSYVERAGIMAVAPSDDALVSGTFETATSFPGGTLSGIAQVPAAFVASLSGANSNHQWSKAAIGGFNNGYNYVIPRSVTHDSAGNAVLLVEGSQNTSGPQSFSISYDGVVETWPAGGGAISPMLLYRTDSTGSLVWHKPLGIFTSAGSVAAYPNGDILVCGDYATTGDIGADFTLPSPDARDVWVARYSSTGTNLWARRYGGGGTDSGAACVALADGSHVVVASSSGDFTIEGTTISGTEGLVIARVADDGTVMWSRRSQGSATVVGLVTNGTVLGLAARLGDTGSVGFDVLSNSAGATDIFLAALAL